MKNKKRTKPIIRVGTLVSVKRGSDAVAVMKGAMVETNAAYALQGKRGKVVSMLEQASARVNIPGEVTSTFGGTIPLNAWYIPMSLLRRAK